MLSFLFLFWFKLSLYFLFWTRFLSWTPKQLSKKNLLEVLHPNRIANKFHQILYISFFFLIIDRIGESVNYFYKLRFSASITKLSNFIFVYLSKFPTWQSSFGTRKCILAIQLMIATNFRLFVISLSQEIGMRESVCVCKWVCVCW